MKIVENACETHTKLFRNCFKIASKIFILPQNRCNNADIYILVEGDEHKHLWSLFLISKYLVNWLKIQLKGTGRNSNTPFMPIQNFHCLLPKSCTFMYFDRIVIKYK